MNPRPKYSSCRDAVGVRRTAFVRRDSIMGGGSVTVEKTGGDYAQAQHQDFRGNTTLQRSRIAAETAM
jgi:hypothetical protein